MEKIHRVHKLLLQGEKSFFVLFNAKTESVNCTFLLNPEKYFCNLTNKNKKKFRQIL